MNGTEGRPSTGDIHGAALHLLSTCNGPEELLQTLAGLVVPGLGSWCVADLLQAPDLVTRIAAVGPDGPLELAPEMGRPFSRRSSANAQGMLARLVDSPQAVIRMSTDQIRALLDDAEPRLRIQARMALELGTEDLLVVGLMSRNRPMGVITIGRSEDRFTDEERDLLRELAIIAGTLLDNYRLAAAQRNIAAALQTHLLPPLPRVPGLTLTARYVPADLALDVGGDWYDVFSPRTGVTSLVIGDATGHDIDAATRMAEVRNLLRALAVCNRGSAATVLDQLDEVALTLGAESSATCLYAEIHRTEDGRAQLRWSSAGHLPPILMRQGAAVALEKPPELMLGVALVGDRTEHRLDLEPGDRLLLFTDGLIETREQPLGERIEVLARALERLAGTPDELLAESLMDELAGGDDDLALLLVGVEP